MLILCYLLYQIHIVWGRDTLKLYVLFGALFLLLVGNRRLSLYIYVNVYNTFLCGLLGFLLGRCRDRSALLLCFLLFNFFDSLNLLVYQEFLIFQLPNPLFFAFRHRVFGVWLNRTLIVSNPLKLTDSERLRDPHLWWKVPLILYFKMVVSLVCFIIFEYFRCYYFLALLNLVRRLNWLNSALSSWNFDNCLVVIFFVKLQIQMQSRRNVFRFPKLFTVTLLASWSWVFWWGRSFALKKPKLDIRLVHYTLLEAATQTMRVRRGLTRPFFDIWVLVVIIWKLSFAFDVHRALRVLFDRAFRHWLSSRNTVNSVAVIILNLVIVDLLNLFQSGFRNIALADL